MFHMLSQGVLGTDSLGGFNVNQLLIKVPSEICVPEIVCKTNTVCM